LKKKVEKKTPVITDVSKRFVEAVESIKNRGLASTYKQIAERLGWNDTDLSLARSGKINIPDEYIKALEEIYKVRIVTGVEDQIITRITERLLRLEAHSEVYESICAELMAKANKKSFSESLSELRGLVKEAVGRRFEKLST
jgi:hypothetical protein